MRWPYILLIIIAVFLNSSFRTTHVKNDRSISRKNVLPTRSSTPTPTPNPSLTPTPTSVPLAGFCLKVPVLLYHHVKPESVAIRLKQTALTVDSGIFEQQMAYLVSQGYKVITAKQLVDALSLNAKLPSKTIVLTFDDGYKDDYDYVYPILQKYHIIGNFMIATGLIGGSDYLSWSQLEDMYRSGLVYLTDHTWSHFALGRGTPDKIKFETETAKNQLQEHTGQKIDIFTYPYGSFNNRAIDILRNDGFIGAFSTIPGFWQCDSFIMTLHRNHVGNVPLAAYGL